MMENTALLRCLHEGRGTNDLHYPVELLLFMSLTAPKPEREAVGQNAFSGSPVVGGEEMSGETCLSKSTEGVKSFFNHF